MDLSVIIISALFIGVGAILLALGIKGFGKDRTKLFIKRCTNKTNGIIDGFDDEKQIVRKKRDYYYYEKYQKTKIKTITYDSPIVLFKVNDVEYRATYFRPMEKNLNLGQKVNVQYNPENPYEYIIIGDKYLRTNSMSAQSTGLFMIILGIVFFLIGGGYIHL